MTQRLRSVLPYIILVVATSVVVSAVVSSRGVSDRVMDLNNSGVWVTNNERSLYGRVNRSAGTFDAAFNDPSQTPGETIDVFQDGEAVVAWTRSQSSLFSVDTRQANASRNEPITVGTLSSVAMGGGVIATISSDKGEVRTTRYWVTALPDLSGLGADRTAAATLTVMSGLEEGVDVAVDASGTVFAASASGQWALIDEEGEVSYGSVDRTLASVTVTLAGGIGVIIDTTSGDLYLTTGTYFSLEPGVVAQQPGDDPTNLIVAQPSGLMTVPLLGGEPSTLYWLPATDGAIAEPVVIDGAVYAAWGGTPGHVAKLDESGTYEQIFPSDGSLLSSPAFRVNRSSVILNDTSVGSVFDIDEKWSMDEWDDVAPEATEFSGEAGDSTQNTPRAEPDHIWVRAGRMSVMHVLDNDENPGTGIVAITKVEGPDADKVVISPDGQTLVVTAPEGQTEDMTVAYTITNRAVNSEHEDFTSNAQVTISMRPPGENSLPYQVGTDPMYTVPSGGAMSLTPGGEWRDDDSDPVSVISASTQDHVIPVTPQGLIAYQAPATQGQITETVDYQVSDGSGEMADGVITVTVMPDSATQAVPPQAMSDSVRGVVGQPVTFYPLDNDVPGCDPLNKQAALALASPVGARVGMTVVSDLLTGTVTVTAESSGAYFLNYVASFGSGFSSGKIRVDIQDSDQVVAMPDTAVVRGTVPVVVDVLANDRDPTGSVLTVISATPTDPDRVRVGIVAGRWLRVDVTSSVVSPAPTTISYVVTNGRAQALGQVSVTQAPAVDMDHVSVVDDYARVRVGDVATISVLNNDTSESGAPLVLNDNVESMDHAGQLRVEDPSASASQATVDVGQAFVDNNHIRYEAPDDIDQQTRVRIEYQAGVASGSVMTGYVWVDIIPEPESAEDASTSTGVRAANMTPTPESVEARVIVGDSVRIPVEIYGQDPDGDSVTLAGLRTPPKYGRVVQFGADWLLYESYPDVGGAGMDSFEFYVQDRYGAAGIGTARIGLAPPSDVPPPLGVDDVVTVQPGVSVTVYPVSNDVVPIGTGDTQIVVEQGEAVVDQKAASVVTTAAGLDEPSRSLSYYLDAGGVAGTSAQILIRSQAGYLNPPNVYDHAADEVDQGVASVDVLDDAWDVDGPDDGIHILSVKSPGSFNGSVVSVPLSDRGQVVPFVVEDSDGAQAMAVVFVPSMSEGRPMLAQDGLITMNRNEAVMVRLNDYIKSPRDQDVSLTAASQVWTTPSGNLDVTVDSSQQVSLQAKNDYVGPAAVTVEVRDSDDPADPYALTGMVTIPVQIGAPTPVLWCPDEIQYLVQGGASRQFDVAALCHAWMPTQAEIDALRYSGSWGLGGDGIQVRGRDQSSLPSDVLVLQALPASQPGTESTLIVGVDGYDVTSQLRIVVTAAPKPTLSVSNVTDVQQGTAVSVPVQVTSTMAGAVQNIVSVTQTSGVSAGVSFDDATIQVTPDKDSHGVATFDVVASDIADDLRIDRQVTASFSVSVYGVPDAPSVPQPSTQLRSKSAVVTFTPGTDNGAPITGYEVKWGNETRSCGMNTTCEITGLPNGQAVRFQVSAFNKAGQSPWSDLGPAVTPNAIPTAVTGFTASSPDCGSVELSWGTTGGEGTAPTAYLLSWNGQTTPVSVPGSVTNYTPTGLDNNMAYTFTIVAQNDAGMSQQPATVKAQSSCRPIWANTNSLTISAQDMGDTAQILVSWAPADPQGPGPIIYQVTRSGPDGTRSFAPTTATTLGDTGVAYDGRSYTYTVTATNATGGSTHTSDTQSQSFLAVGPPAPWSSVGGYSAVKVEATGVDHQIRVSVSSFPNFHDSSGEVRVFVDSAQVGVLRPGAASMTLSGYGNGTDVSVDFMACNSSSCNAAQPSTLAGGPFGKLKTPDLSAEKGSGQEVCFTASGTDNGRGATLVVTASNGLGEAYRSTTLSASKCTSAEGWDKLVTFTAWLESDPTSPSRDNSPVATYDVRSSVGTPDDWDTNSVTATPNGKNGQISLCASSFPKPNGGTLMVSYVIVETNRKGVIGSTGSTGCATVTGLTNGTLYTFTVTASNGTASNRPVQVTATPYGPLLDRLTITRQEGQGTKACVQVATPASGTNGAAANLKLKVGTTLVWQSGMISGKIDSGIQCYDTGGYNLPATFSAQLVADPTTDREDSEIVTVEAYSSIGVPGSLAYATVTPTYTGHDGEVVITVTGSLPAHNGGPNDSLSIGVNGAPDGTTSLSPSNSSSYSAILSGFTNGVPKTITLIPCNSKQCNNTDDGVYIVEVTTYGPLEAPVITAIAGEGTQACVEVSTSASGTNGRPAKLYVSGGTPQESSMLDGAIGPMTSCVDTGGLGQSTTFSAWLISASGLGRDDSPSVSATAYSSAGKPGALSGDNVTITPTGVSGEATIKVSGTLPATNAPPDDKLLIKITGTGMEETSSAADLEEGKTFQVSSQDGSPTDVTFTPCNSQMCNDSGSVTLTVTTYGPMTLTFTKVTYPVPATSFPITACLTFEGNAGGANAQLSFATSGNVSWLYEENWPERTSENAYSTTSSAEMTLAPCWNFSEGSSTITAQLRDNSGRNRTAVTKQVTVEAICDVITHKNPDNPEDSCWVNAHI